MKGNPQLELQEKGVIDSGCSRHMTGNKSYLSDYEEIDGGFVAFGENPQQEVIYVKTRTDNAKKSQKTVKAGQTRTREHLECTRARRML
ncbi:hypothetical protein Tco_1237031 [Tanacetum coccineum]